MFTSKDLEALEVTGGFAGLDYSTSLKAIAAGTLNRVDDSGEPLPADPEAVSAAQTYYLSKWAGEVAQASAQIAQSVGTQTRGRHDALMRNVYSSVGVTPREYAYAMITNDAGDPSDLLRVYSRFIERC